MLLLLLLYYYLLHYIIITKIYGDRRSIWCPRCQHWLPLTLLPFLSQLSPWRTRESQPVHLSIDVEHILAAAHPCQENGCMETGGSVVRIFAVAGDATVYEYANAWGVARPCAYFSATIVNGCAVKNAKVRGHH